MDLDELARDEIERLPVVPGEIQMAHARREHAAIDQPEREMVGHENSGQITQAI